MKSRLLFLLFISVVFFGVEAHGAKRYWIATTAAYWNNTANWSATSGGAGSAGVPGGSDTAYFDGNGTGNDTIDANVDVKWINVGAGYTGTIVQRTYLISVGSTGCNFSGGTFAGGSGNITVSGPVTISGTAFTSTSSILSVTGNFTLSSGSFLHHGGLVSFSVNSLSVTGNILFYDLKFTPSGTTTYTITNTLICNGTLSIAGSGSATFSTGTIRAHGDITVTNAGTAGGGDCTILIDSTLNQTLTGNGTAGAGRLPNVTISKTGGTLLLAALTTSCGRNWVYTQGNVIATVTSGVAFYGSYNLDGQGTSGTTMQFYRLQVGVGTRTLTGDLYCRENFAFTTGTTLSAGTNDITVGGNWNGQGTWSHGNDTVIFNGSSYSRIQGPSGDTVRFAHVILARPAASLTCITPVVIDSSMDFNLGRLKTTTSNILLFRNNAVCVVNNNDSAYVHGPVRKVGNDAFTFPLGDTTLHDSIAYHPLAMTAPASTADQFEARYFAQTQTAGSAKAVTLTSISATQYWTLDRKVGSSTPAVKLYWNRNGDNSAFTEMRVAEWTGSQWTDRGQASTTITNPTGSVTASSALSFGSNPAALVIANATVSKAYSVMNKSEPASGYATTDGYVLYFRFEEEYDDANDSLSFSVTKLADERGAACYYRHRSDSSKKIRRNRAN